MSLNYPNEQADQDFFDESIQKIVDSLTRQSAEKDLIKTVCNDLKEAYGSEPKKVRQLAKLLYEKSVDGLLEETQEIVDVYNQINGEDYD